MIFDIDACEKIIGYSFEDKMLLRKCFTHASYAHEHGNEDNELLEFFGDAIIEYVVTEYLYLNTYGDEGILTAKRAEIVSKNPLIKIVKKLGLNEFMLLGKGQEQSRYQDEKLISSLYEAVVAGIYLDGGINPVKKFVRETLILDFELKEKAERERNRNKAIKDWKSLLQEYVQKYKLGSVSYELLGRKGPDHLPEFRAAALLNGSKLAEAKGKSKKAAETAAAHDALEKLKRQGGKKQ